MTTVKDYGDMELLIEYKLLPKGDSGIYLRATPQVQVWDFNEEADYWKHGADKGSGSLWNNNPDSPGKWPLVFADKPIGEWNRFRIRQLGEPHMGLAQRPARRGRRSPRELLRQDETPLSKGTDPVADPRQ